MRHKKPSCLIVLAGGQTGVDQAAHRAAMANGLLCAGWCPPGRECETGLICPEFPLTPTPEDRSHLAADVPRSQRTEWNVRDSDGTLILDDSGIATDAGTGFACRVAGILGRPLLVVDPRDQKNIEVVKAWLDRYEVRVLNIAGPSENTSPGISKAAFAFLSALFGTTLFNGQETL
ncbi:MAG TPA: putative molybdenum carrier protein [Candidatus Bathyarchaeia archaeon]|nr:putative molybdenum carrier protein [Candidatus Bathyarchaeia archaeon]